MRTPSLVVFFALLCGCGGGSGGDDDDGPIDPAMATTMCEGACDHIADCEPDTELAACQAFCEDLAAASGEQAFTAFAECTTDTACEGDPDLCWESPEPLPEHEQYATRCQERWTECDAFNSDPLTSCSLTGNDHEDAPVLLLSATVTLDLIACFDLDCGGIMACMVDALNAAGACFLYEDLVRAEVCT